MGDAEAVKMSSHNHSENASFPELVYYGANKIYRAEIPLEGVASLDTGQVNCAEAAVE